MLKCIVCGNKGLVATISKINDNKDQECHSVVKPNGENGDCR
jgi:hypothetical protein